jgi:hypothetical protein
MAKQEDRKKHKKRLKEKRKAEKRAARGRFPQLVIIPDGEDPGFMRVVEELVDSFDFDDPDSCSSDDRHMYLLLRTLGLDGIFARLDSQSVAEVAAKHELSREDLIDEILVPLLTHLGEWIFERLPDQYRTNPLPFYFYDIVPQAKHLSIRFQFLPHVKSPHGTIYLSPLEPTVRINDEDFKVGFTRHALERACHRLALNQPITYYDFKRVATHFKTCEYFEVISLPDEQLALRLLGLCSDDLIDIYLRDVAGLDESRISSGKCFFVLGYCPLQIVRNYAVATTFLCPGYRGTPEHALIDSTTMSANERRALHAMASSATLADAIRGHQTEALRWYHRNGVPQVITLEGNIYGIR